MSWIGVCPHPISPTSIQITLAFQIRSHARPQGSAASKGPWFQRSLWAIRAFGSRNCHFHFQSIHIVSGASNLRLHKFQIHTIHTPPPNYNSYLSYLEINHPPLPDTSGCPSKSCRNPLKIGWYIIYIFTWYIIIRGYIYIDIDILRHLKWWFSITMFVYIYISSYNDIS
jgi:hypothetical protein